MIWGVGIDLCDADRIEKASAKPSFRPCFAPAEHLLALGENAVPRPQPANFAAKEAF